MWRGWKRKKYEKKKTFGSNDGRNDTKKESKKSRSVKNITPIGKEMRMPPLALELELTPQGQNPNKTAISPMMTTLTDNDSNSVNFYNTEATKNTVIAKLIELDLNERGDGGNSDGDEDGFADLNEFHQSTIYNKLKWCTNDYSAIKANVYDAEENGWCSLVGSDVFLPSATGRVAEDGNDNIMGDEPQHMTCLENAPEGWLPAGPPATFKLKQE